MKFPEQAPVTEAKKEALRRRVHLLGVDLTLVEVRFARGSGPGGQKVNKTSNVVILSYPPLDITVRSSRDRSRAINAFLALRSLVDAIEQRVDPGASRKNLAAAKLAKQKKRRRRRSRSAGSRSTSDDGD